MEKFMFLFRGGVNHAHNAADSEAAAKNMQKWMQWMGSLQQQGFMAGADPLQPTGKVVSGTKKVVTDGPYAEVKEMVGGYVMVNANDINHAVELSKGCPIFEENGTVEVRPVQKMEM